jgi:hypothetical protein
MNDLVAELETIKLGDQRLNERARQVLADLGAQPGASIPGACGGWPETKAAYRLFDHDRVGPQEVLEPHYACSEQRLGEHPLVLCIQDTSELDYTGKSDIKGLGPLNYETRRGLYLHPTLAVTPERVSLGVLDAWLWAREPGSLGQDKDSHRPIEEKESIRWLEGYQRVCELQARVPETRLVYTADREADIYEVFAERYLAQQAQRPCAEWLIRCEHDRKLSDGRKLWQAAAEAPVLTQVEFDMPATDKRKARHIVQTLQAVPVTLKAPYRPGERLPDVEVTALLAKEVDPPAGEEPITWLLLTSVSIDTAEQALEVLQWYLCRWQIEVFFRILKSGCKVEELQLEHIERLEPALAFYMIIAWRVLYLTMLGRTCPELPCNVVFADEEWQAVYIVAKREAPPEVPPSLNDMIRMVAGFGGFLNRKGDGFPGPQTLWIGLQRTRDFVLGMEAQRVMQKLSYG